MGFEPKNPVSEQPQTFALDRAASETAKSLSCQSYKLREIKHAETISYEIYVM